MRDGIDEEALTRVASLGDPRRRALYRYVVERGGSVGRDEAATAVGVSRALAAYHLDRLADDGLLSVRFERVGDKRGPGAGRPSKLYERSDRQVHVQLPPRDYELAARIFAHALDANTGVDPGVAVLDVARRFGAQAASECHPASLADGSNSSPYCHVLDVMRQLGYEPIDVDGCIRLRNCPFHALVGEHRELVCEMNLAFVQGVAEGIADDVEPVLEPQPGACCVTLRRNAPAQTSSQR